MAWTAPMTAASNSQFDAAQFNTHVRDNLLESDPAKALGTDNYFVSTSANAITTRAPGSASTSGLGTTTSTSYTASLTGSSSGPAVTLTTSTVALVLFSVGMANTLINAQMFASIKVSGDTPTIPSSDTWAIITDGMQQWGNPNEPADQHNRRQSVKLFTGLTAGTNTFTIEYKVGSGTGRFRTRDLIVYPL